MSEEDWWSRWFSRRRWPSLFGGNFMNMDELFRDFEKIFETEFETLSKKAPKDLVQERTLPDGTKVKRWGPFVYGYTVTIGPDGKPKVREFGNIEPETRLGRPKVNVKEQREPLVDVMESDGEVKVIAELPGVDKKDIKLHGTKTILTISVNTPQRKYYKEVKMPTKINPKRAKSNYKNGVLEITIPKTKEEKPKGETIQIE